MTPLPMHTPDGTAANIAAIAALFPHCITESRNAAGAVVQAVDFDLLRQELSASIVEGPQERYQLNWPGKRDALLAANAPIAKTLRPDRAASVDFDTTHNLYIEGDNLDALKLLRETYLGAVKMIYIDPPYNTGHDFVYNDDFAQNSGEYLRRSQQVSDAGERMVANLDSNGRFHSDWLSMMYPRLKLARNLLKDDGVIFISIDDNEVHNLRKLCDEVFGADNFIAQAGWQKVYSPKNQARFLSNDYEFILIYCKAINFFEVGLLPRTSEMDSRYSNLDDERGPWKSGDLVASGERTGGHYIVKNPATGKEYDVPQGKHWAVSEPNMKKMLLENRVSFGKNNDSFPSSKQFLSEVKQGRVASSLLTYKEYGHTDEAKKDFINLFGEEGRTIFETLKPVKLITNLMRIANVKKNDIFLDFFSGSGTSMQAVMEFNSQTNKNIRYIAAQVPEACSIESPAFHYGYKTIAEIGKERIRRAGASIIAYMAAKHAAAAAKAVQGELGAAAPAIAAAPLDTGFRVLKVDTSNMADVYYTPDATTQAQLATLASNIKPDRSAEDLLFQVLLDCGVDLAAPVSSRVIAGQTVWMAREPSGAAGVDLLACFDDAGGINDALVRAMAEQHPARVVFRDAGFANDSVKINVEQLFKALSPTTEIRVL